MRRHLLLASLVVISATAVTVGAQNLTGPNWVGPKVGAPTDTACYRKTLRHGQCPLGYDSDKLGGCWAQCPLEYPVSCGMECIPQSKDCTLEIIAKIQAAANVALGVASNGLIGLIGGPVAGGIRCGVPLFNVVTRIVVLTGELQAQHPTLPSDKIVELVLRKSWVVPELLAVVAGCAGVPAIIGDNMAKLLQLIIEKIVGQGRGMLRPDAFIAFTKDIGLESSVAALSPADMGTFQGLLGPGQAVCGADLVIVLRRVVADVVEMKKIKPQATPEEIKVIIADSDLYSTDIPRVVATCSGPAGTNEVYATRGALRKLLQLVIDRIIDSSSRVGRALTIDEFLAVIQKYQLDKLIGLDLKSIVDLVRAYAQPICGPTSMVGEIDDGPADLAVGLRTVGRAFNGSHGQWTRVGDGLVRIIFESTDTQDVTVNVMSAGTKIASVPVAKGRRVEWTRPIRELQDKTLYLDRWRPGFIGLPGLGGGSLLAWIPRAPAGGHLELHAKLIVS